MPAPIKTRDDDLRVLKILDQADHGDASGARERFGLTNGTLQGLRNRTVYAAGRIPCECAKPENRDGGMPRRWWAS